MKFVVTEQFLIYLTLGKDLRETGHREDYSGLVSLSLSLIAVWIEHCWAKATGQSHSFGRHLCKKGTHELNCAKRLTQPGISCPHKIWVKAELKWLQLLFIRWYLSPRNWFPISSTIRRTSSSENSVYPMWIDCLKFGKKKSVKHSLESLNLLT